MAELPLHNQPVLITGAARRLGAQTARTLHANGARIAIHYRSSSNEADALVAELNAARRDSAIALQADILNIESHAGLIEQVTDAFGGLSVLINNASSFYPTPIGTITEQHWDDLIGSNLKGPLFLAQAAAPELRKARGAIINMVDIHAQRPLAGHVVYCCAKAGLHMLTESLAVELGPDVRVNGIAPGPIMWPENDIDTAEKNEITDTTLLKRTGDPTDIAQAALYLLAHAPFVTGQVLSIDGGRSLRP